MAVAVAAMDAPDLTFVQISDSHVGFHKAANKNVVATFEQAVQRINALPQAPDNSIKAGSVACEAAAARPARIVVAFISLSTSANE